MQEDVAEAIRNAVHEIAIAMLDLAVEDGECRIHGFGQVKSPAAGEVAAVVELHGGMEGGIRLCASAATATALAGNLAGETFAAFAGEAPDAFGEICNMIAGGIQSGLAEVAGEINLTPPRVVGPGGSSPLGMGDFDRVQQQFHAQCGAFVVEAFYLA